MGNAPMKSPFKTTHAKRFTKCPKCGAEYQTVFYEKIHKNICDGKVRKY